MSELQQMNPEEAVEMYRETRRDDTEDATVQKHRYRLQKFPEWCAEAGVEDTTELNGRKLHKFRLWRKQDGELAKVSLRGDLSTIRTFIRFCENVDAVEQGLHEKIELPDLSPEESARDTVIGPEQAEEIETFLQQYRYATREHALFEVLWRTGIRLGTARALDVDDFEEDEERLRVRHRAETDTPLKNKERAERYIALSGDVTAVLTDWIAHNRPDVTDEHGREPLFASRQGRCSKSTLRRTVYRFSQPCYYGDGCPHDRDPSECTAEGYTGGKKCPSSVDPQLTFYINTSHIDELEDSDRVRDHIDEVADTKKQRVSSTIQEAREEIEEHTENSQLSRLNGKVLLGEIASQFGQEMDVLGRTIADNMADEGQQPDGLTEILEEIEETVEEYQHPETLIQG